jgi:hypothetical protein
MGGGIGPDSAHTLDLAAMNADLKEMERLCRYAIREFDRMHREPGEVFDTEPPVELEGEALVAVCMDLVRDSPIDPAEKEAMIRAALAYQD